MIEFKDGMTVGNLVDQLADDYFSQGADALTANMLALRDVVQALDSVLDIGVKMFRSLFDLGKVDQEVSDDA